MNKKERVKFVGQTIKSKREEKGITLRSLAEELNVSFSHLSNIENGTRIPSYNLLFDICINLKLDPVLTFRNIGFFNNPSKQSLQEINRLFHKHNIDWSYDNFIYEVIDINYKRLEDFIINNNNIYVNDSLLSDEEKDILLKIIKLTFHYKNDNNFPTHEEFKKEYTDNQLDNFLNFDQDETDDPGSKTDTDD